MTSRGLLEKLCQERESETVPRLRRHRRADQPARLLPEEPDDVRGHELGGDDGVRLLLASIRIIDEDRATGPEHLQGLRDGDVHDTAEEVDAY